MKKSGFTLSEILVALVIIGVVSAIASPIISNLLPDKNKVAVLKIHKMVTDINEQLLNNVSYYYSNDSCKGLACTQEAPAVSGAKDADKYSLLLQKHLQVKSSASATLFTTADGNVWTFMTDMANFKDDSYAIFQVDVNPDKTDSIVYSSDNTKNIDTYRFKVNPNGSVEGCDSLTKAYLKNPHKLNDRKADYDEAADIESGK